MAAHPSHPLLHIATANLAGLPSLASAIARSSAPPTTTPFAAPSLSSHTSPHALLTCTLESLLDINHLVTELAAATNTVHQLAASQAVAKDELEAQRQVLGKSLVGIRGLVLDKLNEVEELVGELDQVVKSAQDLDVDVTEDGTTDSDLEVAERELQLLRKEWLDNSAMLRELELDMHEFRNMVGVLLSRIKEPQVPVARPPPPPPSAA